jgi:hypothetical protein
MVPIKIFNLKFLAFIRFFFLWRFHVTVFCLIRNLGWGLSFLCLRKSPGDRGHDGTPMVQQMEDRGPGIAIICGIGRTRRRGGERMPARVWSRKYRGEDSNLGNRGG